MSKCSYKQLFIFSGANIRKKHVKQAFRLVFFQKKSKLNTKKHYLYSIYTYRTVILLRINLFNSMYGYLFYLFFFTGSQVSPIPNFLNILRSTSLNITVECTWHPSSFGSCSSAFRQLSSCMLSMDKATSTSSV